MIRHIDDLLLDRVFQPFVDRLAPVASCYGIAAFILTGFMVEHVTYLVYRGLWISLAIVAIWLPAMVCRAYAADRKPPSDVLPIYRIANLPLRAAALVFIPVDACWGLLMASAVAASGSGIMDAVDAFFWVVMWLSEFFMACRKAPPRQRRAKVPAGRLVNAT